VWFIVLLVTGGRTGGMYSSLRDIQTRILRILSISVHLRLQFHGGLSVDCIPTRPVPVAAPPSNVSLSISLNSGVK
jgi:hypothetical protein